MSEFMKSIVQEVMKSKVLKPKENPLISRETRNIYPKSTYHQREKPNHNEAIPKINRPNYQQKNIEKRLSVIAGEQKSIIDKASPVANLNSKENKQRTITKSFNNTQLAKLQSLSLVQGQTLYIKRHPSTDLEKNEKSIFVGQTKDGVKAWQFSNLHPSLKNSFQRSIKANSIGVITSNHCTAGQLFLLNETLRSYPSIKYYMTWDKENKENFVLELYENDTEIVRKAIKSIFQSLSQNAYKQVKAYKTPSPSPWLIKQLGLKTQVEAVAVLEGIESYTAIYLLDRLLKKSTDFTFDYALEKNYLLLFGNYEVISLTTEHILKEAERTN